jgi:FkbM family methyltransferase
MPALSPRVRAAIESRATATNDFFGGWEESDLELLARWAPDPAPLVAPAGTLVDWLGCRTMLSNHSWLPVPDEGWIVVADLPVPDDSVHAETIEYVALLTSIERAAGKDGTYVMYELGSSYAPWSVAAGVVARRAGFERIELLAVEASAATIPRIHEHVALNGLDEAPDVTFRVVNAAVSTSTRKVYFPKIDTAADNGAQATRRRRRVDYRGLAVAYEAVEATTLDKLTAGCERVDFVHLDLQGAEEALLQDHDFLKTATATVSCMMLATQSRLIEGLALRALTERGWRLMRERPTMFQANDRTRDVNGWTTRDGAQIWLNPRWD